MSASLRSLQITLIFLGLLLIGMSIPFILGKIAPNDVYGFRTPRTLADPAVWYVANAFAAKASIACGIVFLALGAIFSAAVRRGITGAAAAGLGLTFMVVPPLALMAVLWLYETRFSS